MPARKLRIVKELPLFDIPEKYKYDEWDVKAWDIYENAPSAIKSAWDFHSDATGNAISFSLCNNTFRHFTQPPLFTFFFPYFHYFINY